METVVLDHSPLSEYLKDEGEAQHEYEREDSATPAGSASPIESPPSSPTFAPAGRPMVKKRFRGQLPDPLRLDIPRTGRIGSLHERYSKAVASTMDGAENFKFLEQFRYTIATSQLLSGHTTLGQQHLLNRQSEASPAVQRDVNGTTSTGLMITTAVALLVAWAMNWVHSGGYSHLTKKRVLLTLGSLAVVAIFFRAYVRQQWLRHLCEQALTEATIFVSRSQDFDSASGAAAALIQEVELVSRGYRLSAPLPPISRMEDRSQIRRCRRLRKALRGRFVEMIQQYNQVVAVVKGFSEQLELEKYYDIYDITDFDITDALQGFSESHFDDLESLRTLKIAAARFHTIRKIFLCALLALNASGDQTDSLRWSMAVEGLKALNETTRESYEMLRTILSEEESFPSVAQPKIPLSPSRERWQSQLRKLNGLSSGIRVLQAKMLLLREESDRYLNEAEDISELGPSLLVQYDSIGQDIRMLVQAWEEGKAALASGIDRNEKRLSSLSTVLSPTTSLSGLTSVDEGGALEALQTLSGEPPPSSSVGVAGEAEHEEVFEAVALPRPRSLLTREERLTKMREERERKEVTREKTEANRGMLRELEMVINLRPKTKSNKARHPISGRISL